MIRHLVAVRFGEATGSDAKRAIFEDLAALDRRIDGILDFQVRGNISVEDELVRGFRDVFWFDFRDTDVRDAYLDDPVHKEIGARLIAALEGGRDGIFVCDFEI